MITVDTNLLVYAHRADSQAFAPSLLILAETEGYWSELRSALEQGQISGPLVHDARVAALCCDHGVRELWTADRDFGRFPQLNVVNPLVGV